jgi:hypothetical protein
MRNPVIAGILLALAGCRAPDTVVLVYVRGTTPRPIVQLEVAASVGEAARSLKVPASPGATIFLPTSFSLQIPREQIGAFTVTVTALDEAGAPMLSGTSAIPELAIGQETPTTVELGGSDDAGAPPDGG